ncbi:hypothetical protein, conserved [Trypanosoma brucei gambiense DAL972]|uniref:Attractin/MKLN-like beta-propeller domain-containing protein n=1 Tax=Trypanosoma brucei gambiense (strain MHOM/CI/86/DAL972) TaxID=679716 RepID=C9ZW92_TRYB9|nr:hypothetical protein, conserved [Trypanosoma brucei gambiense DAL972]CBH13681.1 hypothetical protein, conserved [Trypanosoma brucei gambiense DAL972]|eukprot:XP_011775957.1 hypothetical protein, conserved [Trypanosoma brucei gambiense DAL972]
MALCNSPSRWRTVYCTGDKPPGRIGHTLCANAEETKVFLYGGVNDKFESTSNYLNDYYSFDVTTKRWTHIEMSGDTQSARAFHSAVFYGGSIYIFGGCNGRGRFNKLFSITENGVCKLINSQSAPATRYCHSAASFENCMYIFAGKCGGRNSNRRLSDLFCFNFSTEQWFECPQLGTRPTARSAHAAFTCGRNMIVFGGRNADGECCEDMYSYNYDTFMWRKIEVPNGGAFLGRARNSVVVHHGRVVVFGGWNGRKKLNDLFTYLVDANMVELSRDMEENCPSRRECHVAVVCKNTMIVFGGRFRGDFMSDTAELDLGPKSLKQMCRDWILDGTLCDDDDSTGLKPLTQGLRRFVIRWKELTTKTDPNYKKPQSTYGLHTEALSSDSNSQHE